MHADMALKTGSSMTSYRGTDFGLQGVSKSSL